MQARTRDEELEVARDRLVTAYCQRIQHLPFVEAVYIAPVAGLTIYTLYRGNLLDIDDALYQAESEARKHAPRTGTMFRLLDGSPGRDDRGIVPSVEQV